MLNTKSKAQTQFWVSIIGMAGLVALTITSVVIEAPTELTFMLAGGLVSVTSTAAAWLFRLNGTVGR